MAATRDYRLWVLGGTRDDVFTVSLPAGGPAPQAGALVARVRQILHCDEAVSEAGGEVGDPGLFTARMPLRKLVHKQEHELGYGLDDEDTLPDPSGKKGIIDFVVARARQITDPCLDTTESPLKRPRVARRKCLVTAGPLDTDTDVSVEPHLWRYLPYLDARALLVLRGARRSGKTTLARALLRAAQARGLLARYVDLTGVGVGVGGGRVLDGVARCLGLKAAAEPFAKRLLSWLEDTDVLILDNLDGVLQSPAAGEFLLALQCVRNRRSCAVVLTATRSTLLRAARTATTEAKEKAEEAVQGKKSYLKDAADEDDKDYEEEEDEDEEDEKNEAEDKKSTAPVNEGSALVVTSIDAAEEELVLPLTLAEVRHLGREVQHRVAVPDRWLARVHERCGGHPALVMAALAEAVRALERHGHGWPAGSWWAAVQVAFGADDEMRAVAQEVTRTFIPAEAGAPEPDARGLEQQWLWATRDRVLRSDWWAAVQATLSADKALLGTAVGLARTCCLPTHLCGAHEDRLLDLGLLREVTGGVELVAPLLAEMLLTAPWANDAAQPPAPCGPTVLLPGGRVDYLSLVSSPVFQARAALLPGASGAAATAQQWQHAVFDVLATLVMPYAAISLVHGPPDAAAGGAAAAEAAGFVGVRTAGADGAWGCAVACVEAGADISGPLAMAARLKASAQLRGVTLLLFCPTAWASELQPRTAAGVNDVVFCQCLHHGVNPWRQC